MRAVVQRVNQAAVSIAGVPLSRIGKGLLVLVAISRDDSQKDLLWMAKKIVELRIFNDSQGKLNLSLADIDGELLLISQFTLYGDCKKGRRPSYVEAAAPGFSRQPRKRPYPAPRRKRVYTLRHRHTHRAESRRQPGTQDFEP